MTSTHMQLNHVPADGPGGGPAGGPAGQGTSADLRSSKRAWVQAGDGTKDLATPIGSALTKLQDGQAELGDVPGCRSAAAQRELYTSWHAYVEKVRKRCTSLGGLLASSGHDLAKPDESLKAELDAMKGTYEDTPAVGGQSKGA
ncbi:hypothetical protein [Streptomyces sp. NBC_00525]|uniref:hypothetical protein n=1 Tax=Streptomyces sp. NBC_00525 TaxID=2903660 RepID=UPI002E81031F|nr:hypothetical protein [Streptomyces sp. NBC_00525]WUC93087.1 hypothetical protein OG710_05460 [Streptomyces sp. NBC_00525]